jgi:regulator of protease activity HflC (stomatin/prohibitin superfamily)
VFDKLIDVCIQFIQLFQIYTFVDQYERGVVLTAGKFRGRRIGPGFHFIWPFAVDRVITTNVMPEPVVFGLQSLETKDGRPINIQAAIVYEVVDEYVFLIAKESTRSMLMNTCCGLVSKRVQANDWKDISSPTFADSLKRGLNTRAKKLGCKVSEVEILDCSASTAQKLWHEGITINVG